ncbi:unnamed protein product [Calypogeia fissa]
MGLVDGQTTILFGRALTSLRILHNSGVRDHFFTPALWGLLLKHWMGGPTKLSILFHVVSTDPLRLQLPAPRSRQFDYSTSAVPTLQRGSGGSQARRAFADYTFYEGKGPMSMNPCKPVFKTLYLETGMQINRGNSTSNQQKESVKLNDFHHHSINGVHETDDGVSCCDSSDTDPPVRNASETLPKLQVLNEVVTVLNQISQTDDLSYKLAPFEGKISFRDGTTIMKLINDKRLCFSFYTWLKQQVTFTPDLASLLTVIRFLLLTNKWEKLVLVTEDFFEWGFKLDNGTYCRIIKEASLRGKVTVCDWWFQKMKERGCLPDQTTYNTMIHAYALARMPNKSFAIFDEMKEVGIEPDINTFCHVLNACQRSGDPETAQNVFLQIRNYGMWPDLVTYSILLDTYGKQGKATEAAALFKEMQGAGVTPDAKAYNSLIHAYGKAGMMDQATATFNEYQNLAAQNPDKVVFWTMLHLYSKTGLLQQALAVKRMMRVAKIPVDASCYATLIDGFRRKERWEDAVRAFKEMQRYKYPIEGGMYEMMLKIYSKAGHHVECERIFDQMTAKGFSNRLGMYEIMINIYKRTNNITNATRIYERMRLNKCTPNRNIFNTMIHIYAKAGMIPACEKMAEEMGSAGIKPNKSTFLTLMKAYTAYGQYFSAMDMYNVMQETGIKPDYELSELIVEILLKTGQVEMAEKFLKEIRGDGINPNKRMVSAVLRAGGVVELSKPLAISRTRNPD